MAIMVFMLVLMTVIVAMSVFVLVLVFIATAMVALAQLMDVIGAHARLGHLVDDVTASVVVVRAVHMSRISSGPQHGTANRRMCASVTTQAANGGVHDKARDQRDQCLRSQKHRHSLHGTCSASNSGSISSEVERNTATNVPKVTTRPAYSVAAIAEKPHCGTMPSNEPTTGPRHRRA